MKVYRKSLYIGVYLFVFAFSVRGQSSYFRLNAKFSIKEIDTSGIQKISMGELFLDRNSHVLRFSQKFPETKEMILKDSCMKVIYKDSTFNIPSPKGLLDFNIYSIILSEKLQDFGLKEYGYKLKATKTEEGLVIYEYQAVNPKSKAGKVELVKKLSQLEAFLVYDISGKLVSQTFFREYQNYNGLLVPHKIVQIAYFGAKQNKKITTLSEIKINENARNHLYNP